MTDTLILHASDKKASAARLAQAIEDCGYQAETLTVEDREELAARVRDADAKAVVVVWSRPLVSSVLGHSLQELRKAPNLVEVTIDGITPPSGSDPNRFILLSGWRGEAYHPGWQKLRAEIERRCARGSGEKPRQAPEAAVASSAAPARGPRPGRKILPLAGLGVAGLAALGALAAVQLHRAGPPGRDAAFVEGPSAPASPAAAPAVPAPASGEQPQAATKDTASAAPVTAAEAGAPARAEQTKAPPPAARGAGSGGDTDAPQPSEKDAADARKSPARSRDAHAKSAKKADRVAAIAATRRYSARNSRTMRLFCEGAGRGTPECRVFLRATKQRR